MWKIESITEREGITTIHLSGVTDMEDTVRMVYEVFEDEIAEGDIGIETSNNYTHFNYPGMVHFMSTERSDDELIISY